MARRGSVRLVIMAAGLAFAISSATASAETAAEGVFTVRDVAVDRTADTAAAARELALADGQRRAYRRLMARLVPAGALGVPELDGAGIGALIRDFDVAEEKTSSVRYLAKLTVRFKPGAVRALLRGARVPFAETPSKPILVLPLFDFRGELLLWDDPNPWREAWYAAPANDGLVPLVVPYGDLQDVADIDAAQAIEGNEGRLALIGARYGATQAMVVLARLAVDDMQGSTTLGVTVSHFGAATPEPTTIRQFTAEPGEREEVLLARAVAAIGQGVEAAWKRENLLNFDLATSLVAVVPLGGLDDWIEVRRRLAGIAVVMGVEPITISRRSARIDLSYLGDETRLAAALEAEGLDLVREPLDWVLRLGAVGAATTVIGE